MGSWSHLFYREYFDNAPEIPAIRTLDVDFMIPRPHKIKNNVNIPALLKELDFVPTHDFTTELTKYDHPDLRVEFLTPELGRGDSGPVKIKPLNVEACSLRYLNLIQRYAVELTYQGITARVPEPAAYALHKLIICQRRLNPNRAAKDLSSAIAIAELMAHEPRHKKRLHAVYTELPNKWQKTILDYLEDKSEIIANLLKG